MRIIIAGSREFTDLLTSTGLPKSVTGYLLIRKLHTVIWK